MKMSRARVSMLVSACALSVGCGASPMGTDASVVDAGVDSAAPDTGIVDASAVDAGRDAAGTSDAQLDASAPDVGLDAPLPIDAGTDAFTTCGDHHLDTGEVCDDGNRIGGDGCRADCLGMEVCGDGLADVGEYCPTHVASAHATVVGGGGFLVLDGDADGDLDLYVLVGANVRFVENHGDATFEVDVDAGVDVLGTPLVLDHAPGIDMAIPRGTSIDLYPNRGDGTFDAPINLVVPTSIPFAGGDLDGDGLDDLVLGAGAGTSCSVWLRDGAGVLTSSGAIECGPEIVQVLLADLDVDGHRDALFLHDTTTANVTTARGSGGATFEAPVSVASGFPSRGTLGDVDGDGDLDLAHSVMVLPARIEIVATEHAAPLAPTHIPVTALGNAAPQLVDVNADGCVDLYHFAFTAGTPYRLLRANDCAGTFTDLDPAIPAGAQFGDMNGDGAVDVLVGATGGGVDIFLATP